MHEQTKFDVKWGTEEEAKSFWILDLIHCPSPITRLDYDLRMYPYIVATNRSNKRFGVPVSGVPKLINGFVYNRIIQEELQEDAIPEVLRKCDENVRAGYSDLRNRWENDWLPKIQQQLAEIVRVNLQEVSFSQLREYLVRLRDRVDQLWELHNDLLNPSLLAMHDFEETHRELFPEDSQLDVLEMLGGLSNKTTEANSKLWELGREFARSPSLRTMFVETAETDEAFRDLLHRLRDGSEGGDAWAKIDAYLRIYGERSDDLYIHRPTWIDDPTPMLRGLREAVLQPERSLEDELGQLAVRREAKLAKVREALSPYPKPVVEEYERLLDIAQQSSVLTEDHHFWIDCKITHYLRCAAIEVGRRLVKAGVVDAIEDVFHLGLGEICAIENLEKDVSSLRGLVRERRTLIERYTGVKPPMMLGVPRPLLPMDCAVMRVSMKFNGNIFQPPGDLGGDVVGMPGSGGKVRGVARVIRNVGDTVRLQPNDIMVTAFTLPSWTPFFAKISGLVTNIGGVLCHAAVVAREYGIPAVVGTVRATEAFTDGQMIEVDGNAGIVRVVSS